MKLLTSFLCILLFYVPKIITVNFIDFFMLLPLIDIYSYCNHIHIIVETNLNLYLKSYLHVFELCWKVRGKSLFRHKNRYIDNLQS